jgi:CP family cyanate transporter-like MFS transporter
MGRVRARWPRWPPADGGCGRCSSARSALIAAAPPCGRSPAVGTAGLIALYGGAIAAGTGIAIGGALLPGLVKGRFPDRVGPVTGLYTAGLVGGALIAVLDERAAVDVSGLGWPGSLALWAIPAVLAAVAWWSVSGDRRRVEANAAGSTRFSPWRERRAWLVTLYMGLQSLLFYASLAWLAARYTSLGMDPTTAGLLLGVFSLTQIFSSLGAPVLAHRTGSLAPWIAASVGTCVVCLVLIALVPMASPWLWAGVLGLGMGGQFALALTLIAELAPTPEAAPAYSGMAFFVGYLLGRARTAGGRGAARPDRGVRGPLPRRRRSRRGDLFLGVRAASGRGRTGAGPDDEAGGVLP